MSGPLISVIMSVWNRPGFLALSAASVFAQTYRDFELLIVDDGSTDNTAEVARGICRSDDRARLICKGHTGATESLNRGLSEAKGGAVCIIGSDDLWEPTKLNEQVSFHRIVPDHVLHTEAHMIDVDGNLIRLSNLLSELGGSCPEDFYKRHRNGPYAAFFGSSLFIPAEVMARVGPFEHQPLDDYQWVLRAALVHRIPFALIPRYLISKRLNPRSTSHEGYEYLLREARNVWEQVLMKRAGL